MTIAFGRFKVDRFLKVVNSAAFAILLSSAAFAQSVSWPGYRGPLDNGISIVKNVPLHWSDSTNIAWKLEDPGRGWSSPVVLDGQVWITTATSEGRELWALGIDAGTGRVLHHVRVFEVEELKEKHPLNSFASPSPVIEPGRIYVHYGTYGTACVDTKTGRIIWKRSDINIDHEVGPGSSPFIYRDLLILIMDGTDLQFVEALDKKTGKTVWKQNRGVEFSSPAVDTHKAFSTPIVVHADDQDQLICVGPHVVIAYEPLTGKVIWKVRFEGFSASARPVAGDGMVFFNTGFSLSSIMAVRIEGRGDKTDQAIVWLNKRNTAARSSPLFIDGLLYMVNTSGQAKCLDPKTGTEIWSARVGQETSASPVFAGGRIYTFDEAGLTTVIAPGREFRKIAENQLTGGFMASPAVVDGALFLRTKGYLYKIVGD